MTASERVEALTANYGISARKLAEKCGYIPQRIYDIVNGKTRNISHEIASKIVSLYPEINMSWLLTGEGEMIASEDANAVSGYTTYLLPQSAMGGPLTGFSADGVTIPGCEKIVSPIKDVDFAITIYGDSMAPEYPSGCRVLVKKIDPKSYIAWGNVFVLDTSNGVIIKEVQPSDRENCIKCVSFNPSGKYKPFDVPLSDIFGMYRVLCSITVH